MMDVQYIIFFEFMNEWKLYFNKIDFMLPNFFVSFNISKSHLNLPASLIFALGNKWKGVVFTYKYEHYLLCNFMELINLSRYLLG